MPYVIPFLVLAKKKILFDLMFMYLYLCLKLAPFVLFRKFNDGCCANTAQVF